MNSWEGYSFLLKKCFIFVSFPPDITNCDKLLERRNGKSKPSSLPGNRLKHSTSATLTSQDLHLPGPDPAPARPPQKEEAVSWLELLAMNDELHVSTV